MRQSWETMTSVSAGHIKLTPTQPVGSGRPQRESNPGPPHQEPRDLPTELPRPCNLGETESGNLALLNYIMERERRRALNTDIIIEVQVSMDFISLLILSW